MLRREAEWPSNKNILIADTIWQNQARSQVLWFWGQNTFLGVKDFCFIIWLKQSFLSTTKFVGAQKRFGGNYPECPPCLRAWAETPPESLSFGAFMFVQGG